MYQACRQAGASETAAAQATEFQTRILSLPGGRNLGYAEFGDPHGAPCLYFHFTPGSRLDPAALFAGTRQAWLAGIRLIGVDRPGFGRSDPQPGRTLLDWPNDVAALGDHLSLDRFAVLGASGGGGYALACAHALPHRLTGVLVVSGMGPLAQPGATAGMAAQAGDHLPGEGPHLRRRRHHSAA